MRAARGRARRRAIAPTCGGSHGETWQLLRDVRRPRRTTGSRRTTTRRTRTAASRTARRPPTSAWACSRRCRRTIWGSSTPRRARPDRAHAHDGRGPRAPRGPPAQLVRHARPGAAPAALRVDRRQRATSPAPDRAGPGAARTQRRTGARESRRAPRRSRTRALLLRESLATLAARDATATRPKRMRGPLARGRRHWHAARRDRRAAPTRGAGGAEARVESAGRARPGRGPAPEAADVAMLGATRCCVRLAAAPPDRGPERSQRPSVGALADRAPRRWPTRWTSDSSTIASAASSRSATGSPTREGPGRLDTSYYDLLASEARLASFVAIAKGDVPRSTGSSSGARSSASAACPTLVSWSGSMFEYLMPLLADAELSRTRCSIDPCAAAVQRADRVRARARAFRGESRSRPSTSMDRHGTTSTRRSACPSWG